MAVSVKPDGVPLYVQIRKSLQDDIANNLLVPGQKIASEDELATRFGVSRMTVRQGISDLIDEGLLYRRHGIGTFVARRHIERDHTRLESFIETAKEEGLEINIQVLIADILPAKLKVARSLSIAEGDLVVRVKTLRKVENLPITVHDAYVPHSLFPQLLSEDLEAQHLWTIYEFLWITGETSRPTCRGRVRPMKISQNYWTWMKDFLSYIRSGRYTWLTGHLSNLPIVITGEIGIP